MILLVKQPINHEHTHFYCAISQKTTAKTKDTRQIQYNQCHHQYHTSPVHLSIWCTYVPFSPHHRYCIISAPPVPFWSRLLHQKNTTRFSDLQRLFDLNVKNTLSNLSGVIVMYTSSTSSLLVRLIAEKQYNIFGFTKTVRFEHEKHFKTTWRKLLLVPPRTNLR